MGRYADAAGAITRRLELAQDGAGLIFVPANEHAEVARELVKLDPSVQIRELQVSRARTTASALRESARRLQEAVRGAAGGGA